MAGLGNEREQMEIIAAVVAAAAATHDDAIEARVFRGRPESADGYHLEGLIMQQRQAAAWLREGGERYKLALNLHSDSGEKPHVGFYWGEAAPQTSKALGRVLGGVLSRGLGGQPVLSGDYTGYVFSRELFGTAIAVLLEWGIHTDAAEVTRIMLLAPEVATAIVHELLEHFELGQ